MRRPGYGLGTAFVREFIMVGSMAWAKRAALETYVTLRGGPSRRVRAADAYGEARCIPGSDKQHLDAALRWICRAHDVGADDGVAAMYSFVEGWLGSYPETTGYIIPTLFDAAERLGGDELHHRAVRMADWLMTQQRSCGGFPGLFVGSPAPPRIFNTGQIILGLLRAAREIGSESYLDAARRAGRWLLACQDADGAWRRHELNDVAHTYNVRTAWALVQLAEMTAEPTYRDAALANADWAVAQQCESGWFRNNTFEPNDMLATLHTIAYAMRGLLEIGAATKRPVYVDAARRAAEALHVAWYRRHALPGAFPENWRTSVHWRCIPGECQLAIVWLRLDQITGGEAFRHAALALLDGAKAAQFLREADPDVHGGVSGSLPVNGDYERYCLVSWGPKFLIDGLLLKACADGRHPTG